MLINFFYHLRAARLPVSIKELLTLLEALKKDVIRPSIDDFYYLSRAALVKDEKNIDRFDQVFAHVFKGLERMGEDVPLRIDLEAAMERLPERSRAVVWLHDVEGMTHEEIAELMGMSASFSKSQLARAHLKLRGWLDAEGAGR